MSKVKPRVVQGGERTKKKLRKQASLVKQMDFTQKIVEKELNEINRKVGRLALQTGRDLAMMQERTSTLWELLWAVIDYLKDESNIELKEFEKLLEQHRQIVVGRWNKEKLEDLKKTMKSPQTICEDCFHLANDEEFADEEGNIKCPKCGKEMIYFAPEVEEQEELKKEKSA